MAKNGLIREISCQISWPPFWALSSLTGTLCTSSLILEASFGYICDPRKTSVVREHEEETEIVGLRIWHEIPHKKSTFSTMTGYESMEKKLKMVATMHVVAVKVAWNVAGYHTRQGDHKIKIKNKTRQWNLAAKGSWPLKVSVFQSNFYCIDITK